MHDSVQALYYGLLNAYDAIGRNFSAAVFRTLLVLSFPLGLLIVAFCKGNSSKIVSILLFITGAAIGFEIPLGFLNQLGIGARFWLTLLAVIGLIYLPDSLAFHMVPELGAQIKIRNWICYAEIALIFLALVLS